MWKNNEIIIDINAKKNNENTKTFTLHTKIDTQWNVQNEEEEAENLNLTWFNS